jgi:putative acetyltransferase
VIESITIAEEPIEAPDRQRLLGELEAELRLRYRGDSHPWVKPSPLDVASFLVARDRGGRPVGCVALLGDDDEFVIKRMYVRPEVRGRRLGDRLLSAIEERARQLGARRVKLETGVPQPEAMAVYERNGYYQIEPFGDYADSPLSRCYARDL